MTETDPKILLIDDDNFLLDMYSLKFKKAGLQVDSSVNTQNALDKIRAGNLYDIVLLDIIMPNMDGLDLMKIIRQEKLLPKAVFIMLTNNTEDFEKVRVLNVDDYIVKATMVPSEVIDKVLGIYKTKQKK